WHSLPSSFSVKDQVNNHPAAIRRSLFVTGRERRREALVPARSVSAGDEDSEALRLLRSGDLQHSECPFLHGPDDAVVDEQIAARHLDAHFYDGRAASGNQGGLHVLRRRPPADGAFPVDGVEDLRDNVERGDQVWHAGAHEKLNTT